jgi:RHS repeat-associated protein
VLYSRQRNMFIRDSVYTGHEHLQSVALINMNARLYDPMLHRFLQHDNYIQDPTNTQNFNQYGYVLNNPLKYTDPSGNKFKLTFSDIVAGLEIVAGAIMVAASSVTYGATYIVGASLIAAGAGHFAVAAAQYSQTKDWVSASNNAGLTFGIKFDTDFGYDGAKPDVKNANFVAAKGDPPAKKNPYDNSKMALDISNATYGALESTTASGGKWLGKNGKYYNNSWGGNGATGGRSGALKAAGNYKWAGRATIGVSAGIGIVETVNGYEMDGNQFGYNAQSAAVSSTGSIIGGYYGAQSGAFIGASIGLGFAGLGAVPGAIIGGIIGGFGGSYGGGAIGQASVNYYHNR